MYAETQVQDGGVDIWLFGDGEIMESWTTDGARTMRLAFCPYLLLGGLTCSVRQTRKRLMPKLVVKVSMYDEYFRTVACWKWVHFPSPTMEIAL